MKCLVLFISFKYKSGIVKIVFFKVNIIEDTVKKKEIQNKIKDGKLKKCLSPNISEITVTIKVMPRYWKVNCI